MAGIIRQIKFGDTIPSKIMLADGTESKRVYVGDTMVWNKNNYQFSIDPKTLYAENIEKTYDISIVSTNDDSEIVVPFSVSTDADWVTIKDNGYKIEVSADSLPREGAYEHIEVNGEAFITNVGGIVELPQIVCEWSNTTNRECDVVYKQGEESELSETTHIIQVIGRGVGEYTIQSESPWLHVSGDNVVTADELTDPLASRDGKLKVVGKLTGKTVEISVHQQNNLTEFKEFGIFSELNGNNLIIGVSEESGDAQIVVKKRTYKVDDDTQKRIDGSESEWETTAIKSWTVTQSTVFVCANNSSEISCENNKHNLTSKDETLVFTLQPLEGAISEDEISAYNIVNVSVHQNSDSYMDGGKIFYDYRITGGSVPTINAKGETVKATVNGEYIEFRIFNSDNSRDYLIDENAWKNDTEATYVSEYVSGYTFTYNGLNVSSTNAVSENTGVGRFISNRVVNGSALYIDLNVIQSNREKTEEYRYVNPLLTIDGKTQVEWNPNAAAQDKTFVVESTAMKQFKWTDGNWYDDVREDVEFTSSSITWCSSTDDLDGKTTTLSVMPNSALTDRTFECVVSQVPNQHFNFTPLTAKIVVKQTKREPVRAIEPVTSEPFVPSDETRYVNPSISVAPNTYVTDASIKTRNDFSVTSVAQVEYLWTDGEFYKEASFYNVGYTTSCDSEWCSTSADENNGTASVTVSLYTTDEDLSTISDRFATVMVRQTGTTKTATISVRQKKPEVVEGGDFYYDNNSCSITASLDTYEFDYREQTVNVNVVSYGDKYNIFTDGKYRITVYEDELPYVSSPTDVSNGIYTNGYNQVSFGQYIEDEPREAIITYTQYFDNAHKQPTGKSASIKVKQIGDAPILPEEYKYENYLVTITPNVWNIDAASHSNADFTFVSTKDKYQRFVSGWKKIATENVDVQISEDSKNDWSKIDSIQFNNLVIYSDACHTLEDEFNKNRVKVLSIEQTELNQDGEHTKGSITVTQSFAKLKENGETKFVNLVFDVNPKAYTWIQDGTDERHLTIDSYGYKVYEYTDGLYRGINGDENGDLTQLYYNYTKNGNHWDVINKTTVKPTNVVTDTPYSDKLTYTQYFDELYTQSTGKTSEVTLQHVLAEKTGNIRNEYNIKITSPSEDLNVKTCLDSEFDFVVKSVCEVYYEYTDGNWYKENEIDVPYTVNLTQKQSEESYCYADSTKIYTKNIHNVEELSYNLIVTQENNTASDQIMITVSADTKSDEMQQYRIESVSVDQLNCSGESTPINVISQVRRFKKWGSDKTEVDVVDWIATPGAPYNVERISGNEEIISDGNGNIYASINITGSNRTAMFEITDVNGASSQFEVIQVPSVKTGETYKDNYVLTLSSNKWDIDAAQHMDSSFEYTSTCDVYEIWTCGDATYKETIPVGIDKVGGSEDDPIKILSINTLNKTITLTASPNSSLIEDRNTTLTVKQTDDKGKSATIDVVQEMAKQTGDEWRNITFNIDKTSLSWTGQEQKSQVVNVVSKGYHYYSYTDGSDRTEGEEYIPYYLEPTTLNDWEYNKEDDKTTFTPNTSRVGDYNESVVFKQNIDNGLEKNLTLSHSTAERTGRERYIDYRISLTPSSDIKITDCKPTENTTINVESLCSVEYEYNDGSWKKEGTKEVPYTLTPTSKQSENNYCYVEDGVIKTRNQYSVIELEQTITATQDESEEGQSPKSASIKVTVVSDSKTDTQYDYRITSVTIDRNIDFFGTLPATATVINERQPYTLWESDNSEATRGSWENDITAQPIAIFNSGDSNITTQDGVSFTSTQNVSGSTETRSAQFNFSNTNGATYDQLVTITQDGDKNLGTKTYLNYTLQISPLQWNIDASSQTTTAFVCSSSVEEYENWTSGQLNKKIIFAPFHFDESSLEGDIKVTSIDDGLVPFVKKLTIEANANHDIENGRKKVLTAYHDSTQGTSSSMTVNQSKAELKTGGDSHFVENSYVFNVEPSELVWNANERGTKSVTVESYGYKVYQYTDGVYRGQVSQTTIGDKESIPFSHGAVDSHWTSNSDNISFKITDGQYSYPDGNNDDVVFTQSGTGKTKTVSLIHNAPKKIGETYTDYSIKIISPTEKYIATSCKETSANFTVKSVCNVYYIYDDGQTRLAITDNPVDYTISQTTPQQDNSYWYVDGNLLLTRNQFTNSAVEGGSITVTQTNEPSVVQTHKSDSIQISIPADAMSSIKYNYMIESVSVDKINYFGDAVTPNIVCKKQQYQVWNSDGTTIASIDEWVDDTTSIVTITKVAGGDTNILVSGSSIYSRAKNDGTSERVAYFTFKHSNASYVDGSGNLIQVPVYQEMDSKTGSETRYKANSRVITITPNTHTFTAGGGTFEEITYTSTVIVEEEWLSGWKDLRTDYAEVKICDGSGEGDIQITSVGANQISIWADSYHNISTNRYAYLKIAQIDDETVQGTITVTQEYAKLVSETPIVRDDSQFEIIPSQLTWKQDEVNPQSANVIKNYVRLEYLYTDGKKRGKSNPKNDYDEVIPTISVSKGESYTHWTITNDSLTFTPNTTASIDYSAVFTYTQQYTNATQIVKLVHNKAVKTNEYILQEYSITVSPTSKDFTTCMGTRRTTYDAGVTITVKSKAVRYYLYSDGNYRSSSETEDIGYAITNPDIRTDSPEYQYCYVGEDGKLYARNQHSLQMMDESIVFTQTEQELNIETGELLPAKVVILPVTVVPDTKTTDYNYEIDTITIPDIPSIGGSSNIVTANVRNVYQIVTKWGSDNSVIETSEWLDDTEATITASSVTSNTSVFFTNPTDSTHLEFYAPVANTSLNPKTGQVKFTSSRGKTKYGTITQLAPTWTGEYQYDDYKFTLNGNYATSASLSMSAASQTNSDTTYISTARRLLVLDNGKTRVDTDGESQPIYVDVEIKPKEQLSEDIYVTSLDNKVVSIKANANTDFDNNKTVILTLVQEESNNECTITVTQYPPVLYNPYRTKYVEDSFVFDVEPKELSWAQNDTSAQSVVVTSTARQLYQYTNELWYGRSNKTEEGDVTTVTYTYDILDSSSHWQQSNVGKTYTPKATAHNGELVVNFYQNNSSNSDSVRLSHYAAKPDPSGLTKYMNPILDINMTRLSVTNAKPKYTQIGITSTVDIYELYDDGEYRYKERVSVPYEVTPNSMQSDNVFCYVYDDGSLKYVHTSNKYNTSPTQTTIVATQDYSGFDLSNSNITPSSDTLPVQVAADILTNVSEYDIEVVSCPVIPYSGDNAIANIENRVRVNKVWNSDGTVSEIGEWENDSSAVVSLKNLVGNSNIKSRDNSITFYSETPNDDGEIRTAIATFTNNHTTKEVTCQIEQTMPIYTNYDVSVSVGEYGCNLEGPVYVDITVNHCKYSLNIGGVDYDWRDCNYGISLENCNISGFDYTKNGNVITVKIPSNYHNENAAQGVIVITPDDMSGTTGYAGVVKTREIELNGCPDNLVDEKEFRVTQVEIPQIDYPGGTVSASIILQQQDGKYWSSDNQRQSITRLWHDVSIEDSGVVITSNGGNEYITTDGGIQITAESNDGDVITDTKYALDSLQTEYTISYESEGSYAGPTIVQLEKIGYGKTETSPRQTTFTFMFTWNDDNVQTESITVGNVLASQNGVDKVNITYPSEWSPSTTKAHTITLEPTLEQFAEIVSAGMSGTNKWKYQIRVNSNIGESFTGNDYRLRLSNGWEDDSSLTSYEMSAGTTLLTLFATNEKTSIVGGRKTTPSRTNVFDVVFNDVLETITITQNGDPGSSGSSTGVWEHNNNAGSTINQPITIGDFNAVLPEYWASQSGGTIIVTTSNNEATFVGENEIGRELVYTTFDDYKLEISDGIDVVAFSGGSSEHFFSATRTKHDKVNVTSEKVYQSTSQKSGQIRLTSQTGDESDKTRTITFQIFQLGDSRNNEIVVKEIIETSDNQSYTPNLQWAQNYPKGNGVNKSGAQAPSIALEYNNDKIRVSDGWNYYLAVPSTTYTSSVSGTTISPNLTYQKSESYHFTDGSSRIATGKCFDSVGNVYSNEFTVIQEGEIGDSTVMEGVKVTDTESSATFVANNPWLVVNGTSIAVQPNENIDISDVYSLTVSPTSATKQVGDSYMPTIITEKAEATTYNKTSLRNGTVNVIHSKTVGGNVRSVNVSNNIKVQQAGRYNEIYSEGSWSQDSSLTYNSSSNDVNVAYFSAGSQGGSAFYCNSEGNATLLFEMDDSLKAGNGRSLSGECLLTVEPKTVNEITVKYWTGSSLYNTVTATGSWNVGSTIKTLPVTKPTISGYTYSHNDLPLTVKDGANVINVYYVQQQVNSYPWYISYVNEKNNEELQDKKTGNSTEGTVKTMDTPTIYGYEFYSFDPSEGYFTVGSGLRNYGIVKYTPKTNCPLTVNYLEKGTSSGIRSGISTTAEFGSTVNISGYATAVSGFKYSNSDPSSMKITSVTNNVLNLYYTRNYYTLTITHQYDDGTIISKDSYSCKYNDVITIQNYVKNIIGYKGTPNKASVRINASNTLNTATITYSPTNFNYTIKYIDSSNGQEFTDLRVTGSAPYKSTVTVAREGDETRIPNYELESYDTDVIVINSITSLNVANVYYKPITTGKIIVSYYSYEGNEFKKLKDDVVKEAEIGTTYTPLMNDVVYIAGYAFSSDNSTQSFTVQAGNNYVIMMFNVIVPYKIYHYLENTTTELVSPTNASAPQGYTINVNEYKKTINGYTYVNSNPVALTIVESSVANVGYCYYRANSSTTQQLKASESENGEFAENVTVKLQTRTPDGKAIYFKHNGVLVTPSYNITSQPNGSYVNVPRTGVLNINLVALTDVNTDTGRCSLTATYQNSTCYVNITYVGMNLHITSMRLTQKTGKTGISGKFVLNNNESYGNLTVGDSFAIPIGIPSFVFGTELLVDAVCVATSNNAGTFTCNDVNYTIQSIRSPLDLIRTQNSKCVCYGIPTVTLN